MLTDSVLTGSEFAPGALCCRVLRADGGNEEQPAVTVFQERNTALKVSMV